MMIKRICLAVLGLALLFSCSTRIDGVLRSGGSADLKLRTSLEGRTAAIIRSLRTMMGGGGPEGLILDGPALARSLAAAPGISSVSFTNTGPAAIEGTIAISRIDELLTPTGSGDGRFVTWQESGSSGSLRLSLDRNSAPVVLTLISPEVTAYLEALMAPAVTGERLSRAEYLDQVASVYGRPMAEEIAAARIHLSLDFPRPISQIRGGTAVGNRAEFDLPLLDLLVLESPLVYEAAWN